MKLLGHKIYAPLNLVSAARWLSRMMILGYTSAAKHKVTHLSFSPCLWTMNLLISEVPKRVSCSFSSSLITHVSECLFLHLDHSFCELPTRILINFPAVLQNLLLALIRLHLVHLTLHALLPNIYISKLIYFCLSLSVFI